MFIPMLFSEPLQRVDKCQKQPPQLFYEKGVPRNFTKFTRKHLRLSPILKNLQAWGLGIPEKLDPGYGATQDLGVGPLAGH